MGQTRLPQPPPTPGESRRRQLKRRQILIAVDGSKPRESGYQEYVQAFQLGLTETRAHLLSMVQPAGYCVVFPLRYHHSPHRFTHAAWCMLDTGLRQDYDHAPRIKPA